MRKNNSLSASSFCMLPDWDEGCEEWELEKQ